MKRFLFVIAALVVLGLAYSAHSVHRLVTVTVPNAYATDWSAAMVIEYLKNHENDWPRSWDDLREPYEKLAEPQNYPWSFEELQQRITIDWSADVGSLMDAASVEARRTVKVIWLTDGSETHWQGAEPNQRILDYLRSVLPQTPAVDPV